MPVEDEAVRWAYRMLLGTELQDQRMIDFHKVAYANLGDLRTAFMRTPQAKNLFNRANTGNRLKSVYSIPGFLLKGPEFPDVLWRFSEPNLVEPVSQICTSEQMAGGEYQTLCATLGMNHLRKHRKIWEFTYILAALKNKGMVVPEKRGLGFGTGKEPLPSAFANADVFITATDAPADVESSKGWAKGNQWASELKDLWRRNLVSKEIFVERVNHCAVDMNSIPADLCDFDFCWSACALEHLGSIRHGLDFIRNSLATLKPGGVAVHTTEFNLLSNSETVETKGLSLFRKQDIELVIHEMVQDGHYVEPLNLWPGAAEIDAHIDLPPFSVPHLKLQLGRFTTTSIGITVTKRQ